MSAPSGSATGTVDMVGGPLDNLVMALYAYHNGSTDRRLAPLSNGAEVVAAAERAGFPGLALTPESAWHFIVEIGTNV